MIGRRHDGRLGRIEVLDHGYVELIEPWGSDERIIEAARMSTGGGFKGWGPRWECKGCGRDYVDSYGCGHCPPNTPSAKKPGDEKLLGYLWRNKHTTPFEMAGLTIEVKAPIFIYRQWHRHRTQSYNEMSARYTPLPAEDYIPSVERLMVNSKKNKQAGTAKGSEQLTEQRAEQFREELVEIYDESERVYQQALANGVPKELARIHLPVARYSVMRASANLLNWLKFMTLRCDPHAQWEIRQYADAVGAYVKETFPRTYALWEASR